MPEIKRRRPGAPEIKGWCPGALAPMESGDGLLMRAKIAGSRLTLAQAKEVAEIARDCGNGLIDLSQRAQLQMRGLRAEGCAAAQARLGLIGLLAPNASTEAVLNIIASPLPGGADAIVAKLAHAIAADDELKALPGKFLFLVDDGGAPGLANVAADIRLEAQGEAVAVVVDGARDQAIVALPEAAIAAALALARAFVTLRAERPFALRRMRALVAEQGVEALLQTANLRAEPYRSACQSASLEALLGAHKIGEICFAGAAAPYGRLRAEELAGLAEAAAEAGATELRLTPWRAMLAPTPSIAEAERIAAAAAQLGFVVDAKDARLAIAACPGAPECPQAQGSTREGLVTLARFAREFSQDGIGLHVSGCAKGCAKPSPTPVTLVLRSGGFDLVYDGLASDEPAAAGLTLDEVVKTLAARASGERP